MPRNHAIRSTKAAKPTKATTTVTNPPVQTQVTHSIEKPGIFSSIKQGFGLGVGQSIAMNLFRSNPEVKHDPVYQSQSQSQSKEYLQCMEETGQDKEVCKKHL